MSEVINPIVVPMSVASDAESVELGSTTELRPMPEITIGEVTTLPTGEDATATMTGTYQHPVLNLGLPRGEKGDTGERGEQGESGESYIVRVEDETLIFERVR